MDEDDIDRWLSSDEANSSWVQNNWSENEVRRLLVHKTMLSLQLKYVTYSPVFSQYKMRYIIS